MRIVLIRSIGEHQLQSLGMVRPSLLCPFSGCVCCSFTITFSVSDMVDVTPRRGLMYIWALARAVSEPAKIELSTCSQLVGAEQPRSLVDQDNERGGTVGTRKQHVDLCDCSP